MKIAIIGAGNMGGAIARGLARGTIVKANEIFVANPSNGKLDALKAEFPEINVTNDNDEVVKEADIIILAVKPWMVEQVLSFTKLDIERQVLVSVAGGLSFDRFSEWVSPQMTIFRVIPNTAISERQSMTLIASRNASKEQEQ